MNVEGIDLPGLTAEESEVLKKVLSGFLESSDRLSRAYAAMQEDFRRLNIELDSKNRELASSLARQEEAETYLTSIMESIGSGVIGINTAGAITQFNRQAGEITGYAPADVLGLIYSNIFSRDSKEKPDLVEVLGTGKELVSNEKVMWRKDGYPVPVSYQAAVLRDTGGRVLGAVEIFTDISKIKALEKEMQRTRTMAALGEMSATVAHEIRNPLGAMGVWAGLLDRDFERDDPRRKTLKRIIDGLARLNRIVSNLLVYSRPFEARMRRANLQDILEETVDFIQIEIERLGQSVEVRKAWQQEPIEVMADPEKMQQVIMNLCMNAIQAMPQGGVLTVSADPAPPESSGFVSFGVADTGVGIEAERIDRIFDPFHTTKENGTGLGLAIVRKFVEYQSGHIRVDSTPGKGTLMQVFLPRKDMEGQGV
jgi:PAS domain S-box-containing protein